MTPRKLDEGGPVAPVPEYTNTGIHERDFFIGAALAGGGAFATTDTGEFRFTPEQVADRACRIAAATMERKERAP